MRNHLVLGAVFLILCSLGACKVERDFPQDLHPDEAHWVVFAVGDFQNYGNMAFADGYWTLRHPFCGMTPSGGKLIFCFFLSFFSDGIINPEYHRYDWGKSPLENRADQRFPPDRDIIVGRFLFIFLLTNPSILFTPKAKIRLFLELSTLQTETLVRRFPDLALNGWLAKGKAIFEHAVVKFGNTRFWPVEFLLCLAGIPFALRAIQQSEGQMGLILSFYLFLFVANFLWIPLAFERYFLPFILLLKVLESLSLKEILEGARWIFLRNGEPVPPVG